MLKRSKMSFISLPTGTLYKKPGKNKLKNFLAGYVGKFYRNLANNIDNFLVSEFYGRIANDAEIPYIDVQKYLLATSDFAKGMQTDINHYMTKDRINNASFRQKFDPISKNIFRRQNPLQFVFEDISTFDAEDPIIGSFLKQFDVGKENVASDLIKKVPGPPGTDFVIRSRLNRLKDRQEFNDGISNNNNNLSLPPSPPSPPSFFSDQHHHSHLLQQYFVNNHFYHHHHPLFHLFNHPHHLLLLFYLFNKVFLESKNSQHNQHLH